MKEFSNGLTTMVQQEYYTAGGLTAESLIAKNPSVDLPELLKFVKRHQLNYCTRFFDLILINYVVQFHNSFHAVVLNMNYLLLGSLKGH